MMMRLNLSFSLKEARELVAEINSMPIHDNIVAERFPKLLKLRKRFENPLSVDEEVKIEAQPVNLGLTD